MLDLNTLTLFLGWCAVLNIGLFCFSALAVLFMMGTIIRVHDEWFGVAEAELPLLYFQYLARYKVAIIMLNIVPYFALKIMA